MLAGEATRDVVVSSLNGIDNVMNLQMDAHRGYDTLAWGIEATEHDGMVLGDLNNKSSLLLTYQSDQIYLPNCPPPRCFCRISAPYSFEQRG
jgi:hypothetical protein